MSRIDVWTKDSRRYTFRGVLRWFAGCLIINDGESDVATFAQSDLHLVAHGA